MLLPKFKALKQAMIVSVTSQNWIFTFMFVCCFQCDNEFPGPLPFVAKIEDFLKQDRLLAPHCRYYVREMRIQAYTQLLESYRSLTLQYMANAFGVSEEFIDR